MAFASRRGCKTDLLAGIDEDSAGCVARLDPWRDLIQDPLGLGATARSSRRERMETHDDGTRAERMCLTPRWSGRRRVVHAAVEVGAPLSRATTDAGYHRPALTWPTRRCGPSFEWDSDEPQRWLNPLGLSEGLVLLDRTGEFALVRHRQLNGKHVRHRRPLTRTAPRRPAPGAQRSPGVGVGAGPHPLCPSETKRVSHHGVGDWPQHGHHREVAEYGVLFIDPDDSGKGSAIRPASVRR